MAFEAARTNPKRVLFAEGEEPNVLRAAIAFKEGGYGTPVLIGREDVRESWPSWASINPGDYEVLNSRNSPLVGRAVDFVYAKRSATACCAAKRNAWSTRIATSSPPRCWLLVRAMR